MKVLILVLLYTGFFLIFLNLRMLEKMQRTLRKTRREMNAASRQRTLADRQNILQLQDTHTFWYTLEQKLQYSGLKRIIPGLSVEWWLTGHLVLGAGVWVIGGILWGVLIASVLVVVLLLLDMLVINLLQRRNRKKTEQNLTKLLDFLGNYSVTSGEITGIFDQISRYMEEPIKGALDSCYYEAMTTGDASAALLMMGERLEHPKFKELARNLEISVRYCADMTALVNGSRRSLREYLRASQERKGLLREGFINLALLMGMSVVVLLAIGKLTEMKMSALLFYSWPGRIGLGLLALIFLIFLGKMKQFE